MSQEKKAFKDWFDSTAAESLSRQIKSVWPQFNENQFVKTALRNLDDLEFHDRVGNFSLGLATCLPSDVPRALEILRKSLPEPMENCEDVTDGWLQWPVGRFIADYGVPYFEESMRAMVELTKRFTSEFAVRPFLVQRTDETMQRLYRLTEDENPHVRRWCSEGTRPRLPWGVRLPAFINDPSPLYPIIKKLWNDPEEYVRRSVANSMNDISRDNPDETLNLCRDIRSANHPMSERVLKRGLRTLIKEGDAEALALIGYSSPKMIECSFSLKPAAIAIGNCVDLFITLKNNSSSQQDLLVDYSVTYPRKNGRSSTKVFKGTSIQLAGRHSGTISKKHPMRRTTVRELYAGTHIIQILVNGKVFGEESFELLT